MYISRPSIVQKHPGNLETANPRPISLTNNAVDKGIPAITRPSNTKSQILRPSYQKYITLTLDKYIGYITSNDSYENYCQATTEDKTMLPPDLHDTSTSDPDTADTQNSYMSNDSQSSYSSSDDDDSTTHSTFSATSTSSMWLGPRVPISYNETFLSKRHRLPKVKIMNNLYIP